MKTKTRSFLLSIVVAVLSFVLVAVTSAAQESQETDSKDTQTPALGVNVVSLHPALKAQLGKVIGENRGALIVDVAPDSAAAKAGLKKFDILVTYDGRDISSLEQLTKWVREGKIDAEVELGYVREGAMQKASLKLTAMPDDFARTPLPFSKPLFPIKEWLKVSEPTVPLDHAPLTFEAMTIKKLLDDKYVVHIEVLDKNDKKIEREYTGTYDEVKQAIKSDKELPRRQQQHLLRNLDNRFPGDGSAVDAFGRFDDFGL
jgi:membrane-associated protease RseP (regulator of RpoE activity)